MQWDTMTKNLMKQTSPKGQFSCPKNLLLKSLDTKICMKKPYADVQYTSEGLLTTFLCHIV